MKNFNKNNQKGFISILLACLFALATISVGVYLNSTTAPFHNETTPQLSNGLMVVGGSGQVAPLPVRNFLGLTDTPNSYSGQANKVVSVNAGATALVFTTPASGGTWGSITGTLSDQTDLQTALDGKQPLDSDLTTIAGLTATTNNFITSVGSAWASRTPTQVKTTLSLDNVENTALSTWAGSTNLTTLGTIGTGTWNATAIGFGKGGTGLTSAADDTVMVSNASAWQAKALANCTDTGGNHLNYDTSTNTFSCGTSGSGGAGLTIGSTAITSGTGGRVLYDNAGTLGEMTTTGSGTVLALATSPVLTTPTITTSLLPTSDDGAPLGDTTHNFSDLFLASGGVINFANSNWVATHTSGILTVGTGDLRVTNAGANTASVVTVGGSQTLTGKTLTTPVINGTITGTGQATGATASTITMRDSNANITANNWLGGYTTTATAAGTTTLTVGSTYLQFFTGVTTQTVTMPVVSTLALGTQYVIVNNSTGAVTVNSSGGQALTILAGSTSANFTSIATSGTDQTVWSTSYSGANVASGKKLTASNTITLAGTDATTMTFPTTSATIARTDAANTFTGHQTIEGVTSTGATGTGKFVFDNAPTFTGHPTIEGVTMTGATGSGAIVFGTTPTLATPVINGVITGTGQSATATVSTIAMRDSSANILANLFSPALTSTATAAGTTTMTITSTEVQVWTGSSTQTVKLPTTGITAGARYTIINQSTGAVTVQSSGANTINILGGGTSGIFTAVVATPTTAANWNSQYIGDVVASGKVLTVSNSLTLAGTDGKGINVGAATSGKFLVGDGTNMVLSTSTIPTSAGATANKLLLSNGTDYVLSTPTFPNASATSGKIIKSDGTNWVASTETYAAPGTSGNVLTSDGTNWTSAAASAGTGSYISAPSNTSSISTQNIDTTYTTTFTPKAITLYFHMHGRNSSTDQYTDGIATFDGTTLKSVMYFQANTATATTTYKHSTTAINSTAIQAGGTGGAHMNVLLTVNSVSSTNFVVRVSYETADSSGGDVDYYAVATN